MPSLEERLFHCIEKNLVQKEEVMSSYSKQFDSMCELALTRDFSADFASALNQYKTNAGVTEEDISGYEILHAAEAVESFKYRFMLKPFLFGILIEQKKWKPLLKKLKEASWAEGLFIPASNFSSLAGGLMLNTFGLSIGKDSGVFQHEALHANRQLYSANCRWLDGYDDNPSYSIEEWRARAEYTFIDEILGFVYDNFSMDETRTWLEGKYWQSEVKEIYSHITCGDCSTKRRQVKRRVRTVKRGIPDAVTYSYRLKNRLSSEVLAPLFYSLGAMPEEVNEHNFPSAFNDIKLWVELLDNGIVSQQMIRSELQKKGYCLEPVIISLP